MHQNFFAFIKETKAFLKTYEKGKKYSCMFNLPLTILGARWMKGRLLVGVIPDFCV
jgi:hypothetical protein